MDNGQSKPSVNGQHNKVFKRIILNLDAIGNNPNKFINTLMHEVEHANQETLYRKIKSKHRKDWTVEDREFVAHYNICYRVNKERRMFYNKHKDLIDKFRKNNFHSEEERTKAISQLSEKEQEIIDINDKNFENYWNSLFEVQAREQGVKHAKGYKSKSGYTLSGPSKTKQTNIGTRKKWNMGPNTRNSSRTDQFSIEQPEYRTEPTKEEINKATTVKNSDKIPQVVAKKEVRKWYGGIQKDRYDVNKNLTYFVKFSTYILQDAGM